MRRLWQRTLVALFVFVLALSLLTAWITPLSRDFLTRAALIGLFGGLVTKAFRGKTSSRQNSLLWAFIIFILFVGGYYWARDHAFGGSYKGLSNLRLLMNYWLSLAAFFIGSILVLRIYPRKTL